MYYTEKIFESSIRTKLKKNATTKGQFAVSLRNGNLKSCPGRISDTTCITQWDDVFFFATEDGEDSTVAPLQRMYLAESSAEASAERSQRLASLTKNKTKRSVHHRSQESKKRT